MVDEPARLNLPPLSLHVPEPRFRPGDPVDFSDFVIPPAGAASRPPIDAAPGSMREHSYGLIRVLDDEARAVGAWNPRLEPERLLRMLRHMALTRAFDERMYRAQRQGKTSFYMKCTGEEGTCIPATHALDRGDMVFPSYRQQGVLIARDWPLVDMICQIYSNRGDRLKGRQMPIMYSAKEAELLLDLGQPRHAISAGGRLGDGIGRAAATPGSRRRGAARDRPPRATSIRR